MQSETHSARSRLAAEWILELELVAGARVLDVGCGAGVLALDLASRGFVVDAVDLRPESVERVARSALERGLTDHVTARVADATHLPFPPASFDMATAIGLLPWVSSPSGVLLELARVVRPGGHVLVTAINRGHLALLLDPAQYRAAKPLKRSLRSLGILAPSTAPEPTLLSLGATEQLLREAGLVPLRSATLGYGPFTFFGRELLGKRRARAVNRRLEELAKRRAAWLRTAGSQCIVLAAKA